MGRSLETATRTATTPKYRSVSSWSCPIFLSSRSLLNRTGMAFMPVFVFVGAHALAQPTYGVHNPPSDSPCTNSDCVYVREAGQPTDPRYPDYRSSNWTMYRVFNGYADNPPPCDRAPPPALKPGQDYEISKGATCRLVWQSNRSTETND
jgi:hypothetical protein